MQIKTQDRGYTHRKGKTISCGTKNHFPCLTLPHAHATYPDFIEILQFLYTFVIANAYLEIKRIGQLSVPVNTFSYNKVNSMSFVDKEE
jgi:hypothetical protein